MKPAVLLLALLPLALHAADERQQYRCDNGQRIAISFSADGDGRPQATLHFADGDLSLPQVPAPQGSRYRRDPVSLLIDGEQAVFEDATGNRRQCLRAAPASASFIELEGQVGYRSRQALPPRAELVILIQSHGPAGRKPLTLSEQRYRLNGAQPPIPFNATVDRDLLGKTSRLGVSARIDIGGRTHYRAGPIFPPLSADGQPDAFEIELQPPPGRK